MTDIQTSDVTWWCNR